eukprot:m.177267 g.177267  ORF g.177267 m.177267 type:complete len:187 (-) comp18366_c0_seq11:305-865(-)
MAGPSLADDAAEKAAVTLENLKKASDFKESGNAFYKDKELGKAMRCYHNGHLITRAMLPMSGSEGQAGMFAGMEKTPSKMIPEIKALHHALLNNISAIHFNHGKHDRVIKYTSDVLKDDPRNKSALQRRGKSYWELDKLDKCEADIMTLLAIDPDNKTALLVKSKIAKRVKEYAAKEKSMFKGMFN